MKRIIFCFIIMLLSASNSYADLTWQIVPKFEKAGTFYDGIAPVQYKGLWGFIDTQGRWVIQPQYEEVKPYRGSLIGIKEGDGWRYLDKTGNAIHEGTYPDIATSQEDRGAFQDLAGKWNVIDANGKELQQFIFDSPPVYSEGYAAVLLEGEWGFLDKTTKNIKTVKGASKLFRLSEGLAIFVENDKRGYANARGEKVISAVYFRARKFSNGFAAVSSGPNDDWRLMNSKQDYIFESSDYFMVREFSDGVVPVQTQKGPKWVFVDTEGYGIRGWEGPFEAAYSFREGFALVKTNGRFNFLDREGQFATRAGFEDGYAFNEGLAPIQSLGKWGYVKKSQSEQANAGESSSGYTKFFKKLYVDFADAWTQYDTLSDGSKIGISISLQDKHSIGKGYCNVMVQNEVDILKDDRVAATFHSTFFIDGAVFGSASEGTPAIANDESVGLSVFEFEALTPGVESGGCFLEYDIFKDKHLNECEYIPRYDTPDENLKNLMLRTAENFFNACASPD